MLESAVAALFGHFGERSSAAHRVFEVRPLVEGHAAQSAVRRGSAVIEEGILGADDGIDLGVHQCVAVAERALVDKDLILVAQEQIFEREALGKRLLDDILDVALGIQSFERGSELESGVLDVQALVALFKADLAERGTAVERLIINGSHICGDIDTLD